MLFDFDETLVNLDDFVDWEKAREAVVQAYLKGGIPNEIIMKYRSSVRMLSELYEYVLRSYPHRVGNRIQNQASKALEKFEVQAAKKATLMPGAKDVLAWLKSKGVRIGIVSSNSPVAIEVALTRLSIFRFVDAIVGREFPLKMKPNPDEFRHCLRKLRCTPREAVGVGDRTYDVIGAKEVGIFSVAITTGKSTKEELTRCEPDRVIGSLYEFQPIVGLLL